MKPKIKMLEILSHILSPPAVAAVAAVIFSFLSPNILLSAILGISFLAVTPSLPFLYILKKRLTGMDIRSRRTRASALAAAAASYAASSAVFYYLGYHAMFAISLAYLFVAVAVAINSLFWKISIHAAGIAGPTTALVYVFGIGALPLYLLTLLTVFVRFRLKAHTLPQLIGGTAVAIIVTLLAYLAFY